MNKQNIRIGITGGIGSGKSYVCHLLEQEFHLPVYYCDNEAKRLNVEHADIRRELTELVGTEVYQPDGQLNKPFLADYLFASAQHVQEINNIVHPRLKQDFLRWADIQNAPLVVTEAAILFESGMDQLVDYCILVTAPMDVRIRRILERDNTSIEKAKQRIQAQLDDDSKRKRSQFIVNNDGVTYLLPQLQAIIKQITNNH